MRKKHILKALSLLAAVCITAGCNGSTTTETTTTTATTTAEITTVTEQATITTEETNGIKYCEIPEGMTFEDLCGLFYYKDTQLNFPCTLDEILALDEEFQERFYSENKSVSKVFKSDENGFDLDSIILGTNGDLNSVVDVSKYFSFNVTVTNLEHYSFYKDVLSFNGIHHGDNFSEVIELLGEPCYEDIDFCYYYFKESNKEILLEFTMFDDKFRDARFIYKEEDV